MIKTQSRRFLAAILCLAMVAGLSACLGSKQETSTSGSASSPPEGHTNTSDAMGRYVEQEESLPEEILSVISMEQLPDGSLRLLGDMGGQGVGPYGVFASTDAGRSWAQVEYPWLDALFGCPIASAALTADGVYLTHTANLFAEMPADDAAAGEDEADPAAAEVAQEDAADVEEEAIQSKEAVESADAVDMMAIPFTFVYGDGGGMAEMPFDPTPETDSVITTTLHPAGNGDLISVGMSAMIRQIDTQNWKEQNRIQATTGVGIAPGVASYGSTLAVNSADKIALYNLDSGALTGEILTVGGTGASYITQKVSMVSIPPDGSAYFYANESGIYRVPMDTTVSERLVDGGLSSLGIQNLTFTNIFSVGSDEYLALARTMESGYRLFRYVYNPDIPAEPSETLGVYSLHDNKTIRQAISGYQLQHPDVRVNYQVGLLEGSGMPAADAMRTLSTELLAGKGPDVLVMDDMDVDGFIQKNVLQDMTEVVSGIDTLANITGTYNQDGTLYAVPARFYVPMLLGDGVDKVKNLTDFTAWLDTQYTPDIGIRTEELVERFYASCAYRWFTPDGSLDEAAFRSDLAELGKLAEGIRGVGEVHSFGMVAVDTMLWYGGAISANYAMVSGYVDVSMFDVAIKNRPAGSYSSFPNENGGVFVPSTVLGINAATNAPDNAKSFVQHVLSVEVQNTHLGDGFPVNAAAFESLSQDPMANEATDDMIAQITVPDARTGEMTEVSLSGKWPSVEFMTAFKSMLRSATVPVKANAVIKEMIIDETAGFISGTRSLDDTVSAFKQKMDIYLAE